MADRGSFQAVLRALGACADTLATAQAGAIGLLAAQLEQESGAGGASENEDLKAAEQHGGGRDGRDRHSAATPAGDSRPAFCGVLWDGPLPPVFLRHQLRGPAMGGRAPGSKKMQAAQAQLARAAHRARQSATAAAAAAQGSAAL